MQDIFLVTPGCQTLVETRASVLSQLVQGPLLGVVFDKWEFGKGKNSPRDCTVNR